MDGGSAERLQEHPGHQWLRPLINGGASLLRDLVPVQGRVLSRLALNSECRPAQGAFAWASRAVRQRREGRVDRQVVAAECGRHLSARAAHDGQAPILGGVVRLACPDLAWLNHSVAHFLLHAGVACPWPFLLQPHNALYWSVAWAERGLG